MKSINTPFIKLCLSFVTGILTGFYAGLSVDAVLLITGICLLLFLFSYLRARKLLLQDPFFGFAAFILFFISGILTTTLHLPENQPEHFIHQISDENANAGDQVLLVVIQEELKPDLYNRKFIAEVRKVGQQQTHGKTLLLLPKDSLLSAVKPGDISLVGVHLQKIAAPLNPHQFNYRNFMQNRGIFYQSQLDPEKYISMGSRLRITGLADVLRNKIVNSLQREDFSQEELAIIQALLLGQRQQISEETYFNYAAAGVIHILAVSGLHVGIILFLLHWLLAPLARIKNGNVLRAGITIFLLWTFALLAGLSPSVVRAVTMFTFLALALQMKRRTSAINTLFLSLMVLLLVRPHNLFEVGFQLSYLAVLSIVLFQPLLYNLWEPKFRLLRYFWGLLSVTIAAQAGVLPLSLFYFHQFPGLFFLSNLVILPFLGLILGTGILIILLATLNILPSILSEAYGKMIGTLNRFVEWVAFQEDFLFNDIPFSGKQALAFYLVIFAVFLLLKAPTYGKTLVLLTSILIVQLVFYYEKWSSTSEELIVFHKTRNSVIGIKQQQSLRLAHNLPPDSKQPGPINDYVVGERITRLNIEPLQNIYPVGDKTLLLVDSTGVYEVPGFEPNYILLHNSPRINLERLLNRFQPEMIIADGSNYRSFVNRWANSAKQKEIPFHYTGSNGAVRLKSED